MGSQEAVDPVRHQFLLHPRITVVRTVEIKALRLRFCQACIRALSQFPARKYATGLGLDRGYSAHPMRATFITAALENGAQPRGSCALERPV